MPSYIKSALIIGGGIAGPFAAISLAAHGITSRIFETRTSPTTIGGAINLSPNAVRILAAHGLLPRLHTLGCCVRTLEVFSAHSQKRIGDVPFGDEERYGFDSVRILRSDLQCVLLEAAEERGVAVEYGKKLVDVEEEAEDEVTAVFEDGTKVTAEVLLGCDGIHSAVRGKHVDPGCRASYTGVASAYGIFDLTELTAPLQEIHGKSTRIATSRQGSFLTSICDAAETRLFWAVVMAVDEQDAVRDDGRARQQAATREHIISRFSECPGFGSTVSVVVEKTPDVFFYPVNEMPVGNRWWRGRCILLGDAAHAVSPHLQNVPISLSDDFRCHRKGRASGWRSKTLRC